MPLLNVNGENIELAEDEDMSRNTLADVVDALPSDMAKSDEPLKIEVTVVHKENPFYVTGEEPSWRLRRPRMAS